MPRPHRIQTAGYIHHVVTRGNDKQILFRRNKDFHVFLKYFKKAQSIYPVKIYNFVLMSNHLHFVVEPEQDGNLSALMKIILKQYATYFNSHYKHTGHVFQGRFKSFLIQTELYFFRCLRYIDFNPMKSGISAHPKQYKWCGHNALAYGAKTPLPVALHSLYLGLGRTSQERQDAYRLLIKTLPDENLDLLKKRSCILGDRAFKQKIKMQKVSGT